MPGCLNSSKEMFNLEQGPGVEPVAVLYELLLPELSCRIRIRRQLPYG